MKQDFDLSKAYTKGAKVIYKGEIWVFVTSQTIQTAPIISLGVVPSNKNNWYKKKTEQQKEENILFTQANEVFRKLTDEQRMEVFSDYCRHCGTYEGDSWANRCQCWNDE